MALSRITATFFVSLINRLGIRPPPSQGFNISDTVQPVSLVDSDITLSVSPGGVRVDVGNTFSQGELNAPVAGTLIADTGAQPAGNYLITVQVGVRNEATNTAVEVARRNAANNADIWTMLFGLNDISTAGYLFTLPVVLAINERVVVRVSSTAISGFVRGNLVLQAS